MSPIRFYLRQTQLSHEMRQKGIWVFIFHIFVTKQGITHPYSIVFKEYTFLPNASGIWQKYVHHNKNKLSVGEA